MAKTQLTLLASSVEIQRFGQVVHGRRRRGCGGPKARPTRRRENGFQSERAGADAISVMAWRCRSVSFAVLYFCPCLTLPLPCLVLSLSGCSLGLHASAVSGSGIRVWGLRLDTLSPRCRIGTSTVSLRWRYNSKTLWTTLRCKNIRECRTGKSKQCQRSLLAPDDASAAPLWDAPLVEPGLRSPPAVQSLSPRLALDFHGSLVLSAGSLVIVISKSPPFAEILVFSLFSSPPGLTPRQSPGND